MNARHWILRVMDAVENAASDWTIALLAAFAAGVVVALAVTSQL